VHKSNNSLAHEIAENCVAVRIRKLNRMVTSLYDDSFREFGLTVAQFNLLVAIGSFDKVSPKTVGQILSLEKSSLSRNIEKMKTKGWVETLPGQDLRGHDLALTRSGTVLLKRAKPAWDQAQVKSKEILSDDLQNLLEKINRV
jgi:DNA-binding MarR family transcriptional regulator